MARRITGTLAVAIAALTLAAGAALAHGGYGPGHGPGCGAEGAAAPCGAGAGPGCGPAGGLAAMPTPDEQAAHRAKMATLASYEECKAYLTDFSRQLAARTKDKGQAPVATGVWMCDRMKAHGHFTQ